MRIATFNLLHGKTVSDGRVDADRLRAAVRTLDPDILALQEVDRDQPRSGHLDLTAIAAEAMGAADYLFAPALQGTPGGRWVRADADDPGGPAYGVALLSRWKVREWTVTRLPGLPTRSLHRIPSGRWVVVRDEPRVAVTATVSAPGGPVVVTSTHLSFLSLWNAVQLRLLLRRLHRLPPPNVIMGDLNITGRLPRVLSEWPPIADVATYPVDEPTEQLDHVLVRGDLGNVASIAAPRLPLSDHRALVVEVRHEDDRS